ncbi:hypertrehalosaemic prohormone-like [Haliotis asinina]|uniref:hypertrehalosaemic prohormone-like n=1 Tax=Haliotis asinina TaxID=109174 RepID=UPI003531AF2C
MPSVRSLALALTVVCLLGHTFGQISFSPNWGTGKRSSVLGLDHECWGKSELRILYDVVKVIRRQAESLARCMQDTEAEEAMMKH